MRLSTTYCANKAPQKKVKIKKRYINVLTSQEIQHRGQWLLLWQRTHMPSFSLFLSTVALEFACLYNQLCVLSSFQLVNGLVNHSDRQVFKQMLTTISKAPCITAIGSSFFFFLLDSVLPFQILFHLIFYSFFLKNYLLHSLSCTLCSPNENPHN